MKTRKAVTILSHETLADILFFITVLLVFSMILTTYFNVDNQISASEIARAIGYSMKQAAAGGEGTKIFYNLPARYCEIKITKDKIYVRTEENPWIYALASVWNFVVSRFGIELRYGDYEITNSAGKYIDKDYEIRCGKTYRKRLIFYYKEKKLSIIEHGG